MRNSVREQLNQKWVQFKSSDSGMPAIEFAFVAPVFFLLLFVMIESGIMFFVEYTIQASVNEAARTVRTGQAQAGGYTAAIFKSKICKTVNILVDCNAGLNVYVASEANFATLKANLPTFDKVGPKVDGTPNTPSFSCGGPEKTTAVVATYDWTISASFAMSHMVNFGTNKRRLVGFAMFQNEPFPATGSCAP
jgi:Flp pilus assembly protein TadG